MENLNSCRINVMISDMDKAIEFYIEKLELELVNRYEDHYAEVRAPGLMIGLHPASEKLIKGNNITIGLGVLNFDTTMENLRSKGIDLKLESEGWIRLAHFSDPDGNGLFLAENK